MPTIGDALEREHREIDEHIESFKAGVAAGEWRAESLSKASTALRRHIYVEETQLFPRLREAGFFGPVAVMLREHGELWDALDALDASDSKPDAAPSAHVTSEQLLRMLDAHNTKEEAILYPAISRVLDADADAELQSFLQQGALPAGWVCDARRPS